MKKLYSVVLIVIMASPPALSGEIYSKAGSKGLSFLKIGLGARAGALGDAYVSLANDATAPLWNPAGLNSIDGRDVLFIHNQWFQDIRSEFVGTAMTFGNDGFGLGFLFNTVGDIENRAPQTGKLIGTFSTYDIAFTGAYARRFTRQISLGMTLKILYEKIHIYSSSGFALDLGARISPGIDNVTLGAVIQNIGKMGTMRNEETPLPLTTKVGLNYVSTVESLNGTLLFTADVNKASDYRTTFHTGLEYSLNQRLALRGGYQFGQDERSFSAGIGLRLNMYRLDYAYAPYDYDLGDTHRLTFGISL
ncbi:MAG: PorV/PorQ family protein [Gemmatimonadota bacterium]|nr:MAG: PorV/PorQ family protein [Gemmatimonadota bacterium]